MQYFNQCTTIAEVKALYKQLAKQYHPDCGGDTTIMQQINEEYDKACILVLRESNTSEEEFQKEMKVSEEYRQVIEKIINLPGIVIELVGQWIWVTGNTYPVKDQLKEAGSSHRRKQLGIIVPRNTREEVQTKTLMRLKRSMEVSEWIKKLKPSCYSRRL